MNENKCGWDEFFSLLIRSFVFSRRFKGSGTETGKFKNKPPELFPSGIFSTDFSDCDRELYVIAIGKSRGFFCLTSDKYRWIAPAKHDTITSLTVESKKSTVAIAKRTVLMYDRAWYTQFETHHYKTIIILFAML